MEPCTRPSHRLRHVARVLVIAGFAFAAVTMMSCGGGGDEPVTDQDYADEIEEIEEDYADATEDLDSDNDAIIDDLDGFGEFADALTDLAAEYTAIDAPEAIQPEHEEYAQAITETADAATDAFERADDAESEDDAQEIIDEFFASDEVEASSEACADLQAAADDEEITANYRCAGTPAEPTPVTPEAYAAEVEAIEQTFADAIGSSDASAGPVEEYAQVVGALHDYATAYANLQPPEVIREEHEAYVEAALGIVAEREEILAQAEAAGTEEEAQRIIDDFRAELSPGDEVFNDACAAIQIAADDADIDVDYQCP